MHNKQRLLLYALFGTYCILMLWLLFGQRVGDHAAGITYTAALSRNLNLIPLRTIGEFVSDFGTLHGGRRLHAFINLAGNVVMFLPLGALLPCIWTKLRSWKRLLLTNFLLILCVELVQLFTLLGSFDIDDLLLNLIGVLIGYAGYCLCCRLFGKKEKSL